MATVKGKTCKVIRKNGKYATVRFNATGSEMTVPVSRVLGSGVLSTKKKNTKKKNPSKRRAKRATARKNPWLSFKYHNKQADPVAFFAHKTRVIGRGEKALTRAQQNAAQRAAWKALPAADKKVIVKRLKAAAKRRAK